MQTQFGKPVVVENRAGASTLLGAKVVANAEPDGYTLLIPTVTTLSIAPQLNPKTGVDPVNDFTPIARLGGTNFFLVVRSSFPAKTMREWIDEVKRNPGKYRYASAGIGTPHHIFMELLKKQFGLDITHVPYKGSVEAMPDLLAGRVDMAFLDGSQAVSHIKSGELRALGTSMAKQTDLVEGVPPIAATVPGFDWSGWIMMAGPRGMPKPVVDRIAAQVAELQATPRFADALRNALMEAMPPLSPDRPPPSCATNTSAGSRSSSFPAPSNDVRLSHQQQDQDHESCNAPCGDRPRRQRQGDHRKRRRRRPM